MATLSYRALGGLRRFKYQIPLRKAMAIGGRAMLWTVDLLQAGTAHFNINHLGAVPVEYVVDMYGKVVGFHRDPPAPYYILDRRA